MCCGKISKRARSCRLTHWAPESDGRLTFGRIWSLCVSVQSGKKRSFVPPTSLEQDVQRLWGGGYYLSFKTFPARVSCTRCAYANRKKPLHVQWGGSQWMHDKAAQIDRPISAFTCMIAAAAAAAACLTTQWLIVRDRYLWPPLCHPLPRCNRKKT